MPPRLCVISLAAITSAAQAYSTTLPITITHSAEPRFGERVPYVVVHGPPAARLIDVVVPPRALVESGGRLRLNAVYYITRAIIPALDRVLSLVGADIKVGGG